MHDSLSFTANFDRLEAINTHGPAAKFSDLSSLVFWSCFSPFPHGRSGAPRIQWCHDRSSRVKESSHLPMSLSSSQVRQSQVPLNAPTDFLCRHELLLRPRLLSPDLGVLLHHHSYTDWRQRSLLSHRDSGRRMHRKLCHVLYPWPCSRNVCHRRGHDDSFWWRTCGGNSFQSRICYRHGHTRQFWRWCYHSTFVDAGTICMS